MTIANTIAELDDLSVGVNAEARARLLAYRAYLVDLQRRYA
jgi:hypothetical protein